MILLTLYLAPSFYMSYKYQFLPTMAIMTAGSLEGICCNMGKISSSTNHLSMWVNSFPIQTSPLTLTDNKFVSTHTRLIRGKSKDFVA